MKSKKCSKVLICAVFEVRNRISTAKSGLNYLTKKDAVFYFTTITKGFTYLQIPKN